MWPAESPGAPHPERGNRAVLIVVVAAVIFIVAGTVTGLLVAHRGNAHPATPVVAESTHPTASATKTVVPSGSPSPSVSPSVSVSTVANFAAVYAREQTGVVRIETLSCSDAGIGTGFLLSPTLIATVNHVIDQSVVVSLIDGAQRTTGTVIGSDPTRDLALVQASAPITG